MNVAFLSHKNIQHIVTDLDKYKKGILNPELKWYSCVCVSFSTFLFV